MKTIMTLTIILLCIFTLFLPVYNGKKKSVETPKTFLSDIDFSMGDYALYVRHKELGDFLVDDEAVLKANRNKIKLKRSASNFLPGEGDRSSGLYLFKNGKLLKRKTGIQFSLFEIGDIAQYGKNQLSVEGIIINKA